MQRASEPFSNVLLSELWALISLRPEKRPQANVKRVVDWFRRRVDLLQNISDDDCYEVLLNCAAVEAEEEDVLIEQGERDPSLYILLKGQVTVYCNHKLLGVVYRSNEEELESSRVSIGKSDGDGGGEDVLSLLKSASSKAGDEKVMNSRRQSALLEPPPPPASRRSSAGQNNAPLLPPSPTAHRNNADNILLVPQESRHGSAQLEVSSLGSSPSSVQIEAPLSKSPHGSAQLELPPSATRRGKVSTLLQSPTTSEPRASVSRELRTSKRGSDVSAYATRRLNLRALGIGRESLGRNVFHYVEGGAFGEVCFVQPDTGRTASVVADEHCLLLRIARAHYSRSLLMYLKFEFEQRAAVLRESPLFKSCPPSLESFICVSLRPMNVSSQELLVEEGSAIPGVFCIARNGKRPNSLRASRPSTADKELTLLCPFGSFGLAEISLGANDAEEQNLALFRYRCKESALIFLLSRHNVELLCRRSRPVNTQLALLARDWLRHQLANLSSAASSSTGEVTQVSSTKMKELTPQQRIAQYVERLDAQVKRLEATRLPSPTRRASESDEESPEDKERRQLVDMYLADRMQLLKPICSDTLTNLEYSTKKRKFWNQRLDELRREQAENDKRKWRTPRARTLLELRREAIRFSPLTKGDRQNSSSSIHTTDSRRSDISRSTFAQKPVIEQRDLLPAYLRDSRSATNSFMEYDRLMDQLEKQIGARVEAAARERERFYAMQKRVFELHQDSLHDRFAQDEVEPVEAALMRFAHSGVNKAPLDDPVVEETIHRLVPICKSLHEQQLSRNPKPRAVRAKFDREQFDRETRDQLCGILVDYLQSDQRVQLALRRFRRLTSVKTGHIHTSNAHMMDLYASKQIRDCIARLLDYLRKTPGLPQTSHLAESRKISLKKYECPLAYAQLAQVLYSLVTGAHLNELADLFASNHRAADNVSDRALNSLEERAEQFVQQLVELKRHVGTHLRVSHAESSNISSHRAISPLKRLSPKVRTRRLGLEKYNDNAVSYR